MIVIAFVETQCLRLIRAFQRNASPVEKVEYAINPAFQRNASSVEKVEYMINPAFQRNASSVEKEPP